MERCWKNGETVIGQHLLTGKEHPPLTSPIRDLFLNLGLRGRTPARSQIPERNRKLISSADLICYAPGSFHTSLVANLLADGAGRSIAARTVPKVYVPAMGADPEAGGMDLPHRVRTLLAYLRKDAGSDCPVNRLLNLVVADQSVPESEAAEVSALGVAVVRLDLVSEQSAPYYDPAALCDALVSLV
ncbi:2-phospho-L-lactate transferase CofD family protein [Roseibium salinum]|nr:2-phospho-L-lactate transferase CofD family protein [Roseibium salinum]